MSEQIPYTLLEAACAHFEFGQLHDATPAIGGLAHQVYRCATSRGTVAVKQMVIGAHEPGFEARIELSSSVERSAHSARILIPEILTPPQTDNVLASVADQHGTQYFIRAHRWLDGYKPIKENKLTDPMWLAQILTHLHRSGAIPPDGYRPQTYSKPDWNHWLHEGKAHKSSWSQDLARALGPIRAFEALIADWEAMAANRPLVPSHRDLTGKNVLRCGRRYAIGDWDSAAWIHEALQDVFTVAIDWSGVRQGRLSEKRISAVVQSYLKYTGYQPPYRDTRIYCSDWAAGVLPWLACNLERSFSLDEVQRRLGSMEAHNMLTLVAKVGEWALNRAPDLPRA